MWTSWAVLAACAVITQSFPRPDEYNIPAVPFGRRAQYYVLHDDGDFKYGYDTGDGAYESAVKMGSGDLTGFFGYNDAYGDKVRVDYTAGAGGYQPTGNIIPTVPEAGAASVAHSASVLLKSAPVATTSHAAHNFEEANVRSANQLDGSYSFSYDNSDSSRSESADSANNVVGQYSFVADDGQNRQIRYHAGAATGYVAEGDSIPVAPEAPAAPAPATLYNAPVRAAPATLYNAPAATATHSAGSSHSGASAYSATSSADQPRGDASYSFSYQTDDSAREESSDSDLNVKGAYSFIADDGVKRKVNYIAGSSTGFVAHGAHLPVAPKVPAVPASLATYSAPVAPAASPVHYNAPAAALPVQYSAPAAASVHSNEPRGDASYNFNYQSDQSSRSETSDSDLNVAGEYSFIGDDGVRRSVSYKAGSGIGFVAQGSHLPVAPEAPAASAQQYSAPSSHVVPTPTTYGGGGSIAHGNTGVQSSSGVDGGYSFSYTNSDSSRSETADSENNVVGEYSYVADDGINRQINYKAGSGIGFVAQGDSIPVAPEAPVAVAQQYSAPSSHVAPTPTVYGSSVDAGHSQQSFGPRGDASYSFSYQNEDSAREETADKDLNVKGRFSFVADDGQQRTVNYIAGSATGFVAQGDHLPVAPEAPVAAAQQYSAHTSAVAPTPTFYGQAESSALSHSNAQSSSGVDGGYSFSYTNSDSSRSETADSENNVVGQYSFVADDGINRQVNYKAGSETGFVAEGDHLPVAPEAPVAAAQQYSAHTSAVAPTPTVYASGLSSGHVGSSVDAGHSQQSFGSRDDASYSFSYQNEDSAREETADKDLNVKGRFSFVADDGQQRTVNYIAGSATGFVAQGDHLPVAELPASISGFSSSGSASPTQYSGSSTSGSSASHSGAQSYSSNNFGSNDASYSFSYDNENSARDESADSNLNVKGHFKFVGDDGVERQVNYIAGSDTGFVAQGAHLPVAPVVTAGSSASSTHHFKSSGSSATSSSAAGGSSGYHYSAPAAPAFQASSVDSTGSVTKYSAASSGLQHHSGGHTSGIVGNVLLNQYAPGRSKYGYVFTEV